MPAVRLFWFTALSLTTAICAAQRIPVVRVGLQSLAIGERVRVSSNGAFAALDPAVNQVLAKFEPQQSAEVSAVANQVRVGTLLVDALYFSTSSDTLKLNGPTIGRNYRGWLHFTARSGKLVAVNEVGLETYLMGVVPCEMSATSPIEALKAQAVAARTYTLRRIGSFASQGFDVDDTTRCHTYKGAQLESARTNEAIRLTSNQVLIYNGQPIEALYATVSGGTTASAAEAFQGGGAPYLVSVKDCDSNGVPYAQGNAWFSWVLDITPQQLGAVLAKAGKDVGIPGQLGVTVRTNSGRVGELTIVGDKGRQSLPGNQLRSIFGTEVLRSTLFEVQPTPTGWRLNGKGWGHGVGMCQAGAVGRANAGQTYAEILSAYYVGAQLFVYRGSPIELATRGSWVDRRKYSPTGR